jgi:hypothetical protein
MKGIGIAGIVLAVVLGACGKDGASKGDVAKGSGPKFDLAKQRAALAGLGKPFDGAIDLTERGGPAIVIRNARMLCRWSGNDTSCFNCGNSKCDPGDKEETDLVYVEDVEVTFSVPNCDCATCPSCPNGCKALCELRARRNARPIEP